MQFLNKGCFILKFESGKSAIWRHAIAAVTHISLLFHIFFKTMIVVFDFSATIKFCQMKLFVQSAEPGASTEKTKIFGVAPSTYVIRNTRKGRSCGFSVSDRKGTFLDRIRYPPWKMMLFVNHFLSRYWDHKGVMESLHLSSATSVDWRSFCCELQTTGLPTKKQ